MTKILHYIIPVWRAVMACSTAVGAQPTGTPASSAPEAPTTTYAPVQIDGRKLFAVAGTGTLSAAQRAEKIHRRLDSLITRRDPVQSFTPQDVLWHDTESLITLGEQPIVNVTDVDAQEVLMTREELALLWGSKLASAVRDARAAQANPLAGTGILIRNSCTDLVTATLQWLPRLAGALVVWVLFWGLARGVRWAARGGKRLGQPGRGPWQRSASHLALRLQEQREYVSTPGGEGLAL